MGTASSRFRRSLTRRVASEAGVSLAELMVVVVLFSMIGTAAILGFSSFSTVTRKVDDKTTALAEVRQALELMIRDIRAADPIDPQTPISAYDTSIGFNVYCSQPGVGGCTANRLRPIRYTFENNSLKRVAGTSVTFVGPAGPATLPGPLQRSAIINTAAEPVFTYYDAKGVPLVTTGIDAVPATNFQNCARRVEVHLVVRSEAGNASSRVDLRTTIDLRNYHEVKQCTTAG